MTPFTKIILLILLLLAPFIFTICPLYQGTSASGTLCIPCSDANCLNCSFSYMACLECLPQHGVASNASCMPCSVITCDNCQIDYNLCDDCMTGYGGVNNSNVCEPCHISNCIQCSPDAYQCLICIVDYGVFGTNFCKPCSFNQYCVQCKSDNVLNCTKCEPAYGVDLTRLCVPCNTTFLTCVPEDYTQCLTCLPLFYLVPGTTVCEPCMDHCTDCTTSFGASCVACEDSFYLASPPSCEPCPFYCALCFLNLTSIECTSCVSNSTLINATNTTSAFCTEPVCGDSYTKLFQCDNELGVPYDGCNDTCQPMDNFTCNVSALSGKTQCSYSGQLNLTFVSFYRPNRGVNEFQIHVILLPPLYAFIVSTQDQIKQLFAFSLANTTPNSLHYDISTSTLILSGTLTADLTDTNLLISFSPQLNFSTSPFFFASVNQNFTISVNFGSNQISFFTESVAMKMLAIAVVCLGWLGVIVGFGVRKLAGFEPMFVIQISFVGLMWFPKKFLSFRQLAALKYSGGLSYPFLGVDNNSTSTVPYNYQLGLSSLNLASNINLMLILQVISLILVLIFYTRKRTFQQDNKIIPNTVFRDPELFSEYRKVTQAYQSKQQLLFYITLVTLIVVVNFSLQFMLAGDKGDVISWIVLAGFGIFLVVEIGRFKMFPDLFGVFRDSFQVTVLALNHYTLMIIFLIITVILIIMLHTAYWVPIIPVSLMLLYTLAYRPYKTIADNLRSAFNMAVTGLIIGLRFWASLCDQDTIYSKQFELMVLLALGLAMLVAIVGVLYSIGSFCCEKSKKKKQEQNQNDEQALANKIVREMVAINPNEQIGNISVNNTYRKILQNNANLIKVSNELKNCQNTNNDQLDYEPPNLQNSPSNQLNTHSTPNLHQIIGRVKSRPLQGEQVKEMEVSESYRRRQFLKQSMAEESLQSKKQEKLKSKQEKPKNKDKVQNSSPLRQHQQKTIKLKPVLQTEQISFTGLPKIERIKKQVALRVLKDENRYIQYTAAMDIVDRERWMHCEQEDLNGCQAYAGIQVNEKKNNNRDQKKQNQQKKSLEGPDN